MATLRFRVVPNAKVDSVVGEHGAAIRIKLRAPAVEGKANAALRRFLSKELRTVKLPSGGEIGLYQPTHITAIE